MKNLLIPALLSLTILSGCASQKHWSATGGSKSDGTVRLSYEVGEFEKPEVNESQGRRLAKRRCQSWGYSDADAFGGTTRQCQQGGGFSGCQRWLVTKEYQCVGTESRSNQASNKPKAYPSSQPTTEYGRLAFKAEKLSVALECNRSLQTLSLSPEVYQVQCPNGEARLIKCQSNSCRVVD